MYGARKDWQVVQVIVPAALCCSLTAVQVVSLLLLQTPVRVSDFYDPGTALRTNNGWSLYLTTCAVPHSAAGPLAASAVIASCAVWPTPLNAVAAAVLLKRVRSWSLEAPIPKGDPSPTQSPAASPPLSPRSPRNHGPLPHSPLAPDSLYSNLLPEDTGSPHNSNLPEESRFAPFLKAHEAELLAGWVAFQITFSFILQMPSFTKYATNDLLKWANIGIVAESANLPTGILVAMHAALLASLFLALTAVRCTADPKTRLWPKRTPFVSHVAKLLDVKADGQSPGSRLAAVVDHERHRTPLGGNGAIQPRGDAGYGSVGAPRGHTAVATQQDLLHTDPGASLLPLLSPLAIC